MLLTDVANTVSIFDKVYSLQYSESFTGSLFMTSNIAPYMSLRNSPLEVFSNSQQNYNCCLLTIGINTDPKVKRQKKCQLLHLSPNQLDGLITNLFLDVYILSFG